MMRFKAGRAAGKGLCAMVGKAAEAGWLRELGVTAFIVSSDQGFHAAGRRAGTGRIQAERRMKRHV